MARRYFNWKLAVVLVMGLAVLAATAFGLRHWQRDRRASQGIVLGNKAYSEGNWHDAAEQYGRYLGVMPSDVPILLKYAESQHNIRPLKSANVQQSIAAYRNVLRLEPGQDEAACKLSEIYLSVGMQGEAEQVAERALQSVQSPKLRRIQAIAMAGQRKFTEAAKELESIIKENPGDILSCDILGKLIEQRPEDFNTSPQLWFDEAVTKNPDSAQAFIARGAYYLRHGEKTKAITDFNEASKKDLSDPNIRLQLADSFVDAGDFEQARRHIEIVAGQNPSNQNLWRVWAQLAIKSGSTSMMLEVADNGLKSLSLQPWDFMPLAAELYMRAGRLDKAADCISQLRSKDIAPASTAFLEGLMAEAKGQGYEAVRCWQKAKDLGGDSATLRVVLANALSNLGDTQSAVKQLRMLISENPNYVKARIDLATLLGESGKWDESLEHARVAVQLAPQNTGAVLAYARARVHLIVDKSAKYNSAADSDIEQYLQKLDDTTGGLIDVKLLQIQMAMHRNDFAAAEIIINALKTAYPSDVRVVMAEANLLIVQGKTDEATAVLAQVLKKSPDSVFIVKTLAGLLFTHGSRQQCEDMVVQAMANCQLPSAKKQMGLLLARLYADWHEETKQCDLLSRLSAQYPDDISLLRARFVCPDVFKNLTQAQKIVDDIKAIEGEKGWQWRYEQARLWFIQSDFKTSYPQIVLLLKENLLIDPDNQLSRMLLAAAYEKAGDMRLAIAIYEEALSRSPEDVRIIVATAGALYRVKEYDRADQILRRAAESQPENPELKRLQVQSFIRRGEIDSAGAILEDLFVADSNNLSIGISLAFMQMQQNRMDEASKTLLALSAIEPNSFPVAAANVELTFRRGKTAEAIEMCNEIVQKFHDASAFILRARTLASVGQIDKAQIDIEQAVLNEPNNAEVWLAKSNFYRSINRMDKATEDIQHVLLLDPASTRAQKLAAFIYMASSDPAMRHEGAVLLDNALQSSPSDIDLRLLKSRELISYGTSPSLEDAKNILETVTNQQPLNTDAWQLLAEIAAKQGQSVKALDIVLRGLAYRPNDKGLLLLRATILKERSPTLAIPVFHALRELEPNSFDTAVYLAEAYIDAAEYGQAIALLKMQLEMQNTPENQRRLKVMLGTAMYKSGNRAGAEEIFTALQQSLPDDAMPLLARIRLLKGEKSWAQIDAMVQKWRQSHPDDLNVPLIVANELAVSQGAEPKKIAENLFKGILQQKSDSRITLYSFAIMLQTSGRPDEAAELYQRILSVDPNYLVALNNLAWIMCENKNQYEKALELAERGIKIEPNYVDLLDTRGMAYYRLGQFERAAADFSRCVNLYPAGKTALVSSYFNLARALEKLGKTSQASENAKKAMELNSTTGGLTDADLAEARKLLQKLSEGGS